MCKTTCTPHYPLRSNILIKYTPFICSVTKHHVICQIYTTSGRVTSLWSPWECFLCTLEWTLDVPPFKFNSGL